MKYVYMIYEYTHLYLNKTQFLDIWEIYIYTYQFSGPDCCLVNCPPQLQRQPYIRVLLCTLGIRWANNKKHPINPCPEMVVFDQQEWQTWPSILVMLALARGRHYAASHMASGKSPAFKPALEK